MPTSFCISPPCCGSGAAAPRSRPPRRAIITPSSSARNEAAVIGDLLASLRAQTYPRELLTVYVLADNCTDDTARIAREGGAVVYERFNRQQVGKGYALQTLLTHIARDVPAGYDGYFVFDADNLLSPDYIEQMNRTFSAGHDIITSYRASKNYGDNWISAGYALWFLRESRYLNHARSLLGHSSSRGGSARGLSTGSRAGTTGRSPRRSSCRRSSCWRGSW